MKPSDAIPLSPASARDLASELHARMESELMPVTAALRFASEALRVLDKLQSHAQYTREIGEALAKACPDWSNWSQCDPNRSLSDLAWLAHEKACELTKAVGQYADAFSYVDAALAAGEATGESKP